MISAAITKKQRDFIVRHADLIRSDDDARVLTVLSRNPDTRRFAQANLNPGGLRRQVERFDPRDTTMRYRLVIALEDSTNADFFRPPA